MLTLPAIGLLRENFPAAHLEILGYRHIVALAEKRFYADAVRSIEYAALASFFSRGAELPTDLVQYFGSFDQVVSYLYDPDEIFAENLKCAGVRNLLCGSPKISGNEHAAHQLARPLERLALFLDDPAAKLYPTEKDRAAAAEMFAAPYIALHAGSGGERKNWPSDNWRRLVRHFAGERLLVISGEADREHVAPADEIARAENLPLPLLAAVLERAALFIGHDSGVSHIAAAVGAPCVLMFGPTDPRVWAPANTGVRVVQVRDGNMATISVDEVAAAAYALRRA